MSEDTVEVQVRPPLPAGSQIRSTEDILYGGSGNINIPIRISDTAPPEDIVAHYHIVQRDNSNYYVTLSANRDNNSQQYTVIFTIDENNLPAGFVVGAIPTWTITVIDADQ